MRGLDFYLKKLYNLITMKKIFIAIFLIFAFCEKEKNIKEEKK
jgi:hypothetical protein